VIDAGYLPRDLARAFANRVPPWDPRHSPCKRGHAPRRNLAAFVAFAARV